MQQMNGKTEVNTMPVKPWGMITKNNCPFCVNAKELLEAKGIDYNEYNIDDPRTGMIFRMILKERGWKTVPQIFEGEKHIGGYNDLVRYFNG